MKAIFISDTHNDHARLTIAPCDVLIHCGDACTKGNFSEGQAFLYWFVKQKAKYKLVIPGNHDFKMKTHPELIQLAYDLGIIVLNNDSYNLEGRKIYGVSTTFKAHDYVHLEGRLPAPTIQDRINAWKDIPNNLDLLLTHMPPYGILDTNEEGNHIGCKMLLEKIKEVKPKIHMFGHVHEHAMQQAKVYDTDFYNVACKNRQYFLVYPNGFEMEI